MPVTLLKSKWASGHLVFHGAGRMEFQQVSVETDGAVLKVGSVSAPLNSLAASQSMVRLIFDLDHTGSYGLYTRSYVSTAGISADAARIFGTVNNIAAGTARGLHVSLSMGTSGTVTGLGAALEATLHIPSTAGQTGTITAVNAAINADAATSDPVGATSLSVFRVVNQGDATGMADVDSDAVLLDFSGWAVTTGAMLYDSTGGAPANTNGSIKIRLPSGALAYLMYYDAQAA